MKSNFGDRFEIQNEVENVYQNDIYQTVSEASSESIPKNLDTSIDNKLLEIINRKKLEQQDTDRAFLISLLPDYKQLNRDQKLDFRIGVVNLIQNIKKNVNTNLF